MSNAATTDDEEFDAHEPDELDLFEHDLFEHDLLAAAASDEDLAGYIADTEAAGIEVGPPLWERLPGETDAQYRQFIIFRDSRKWWDAVPRKLNEIRVGLGYSRNGDCHIYGVARKFRWKERCAAWDDNERRYYETKVRQADLDLIEQHRSLARMAGTTAGIAMAAAGRTWGDHVQQAQVPMRAEDAASAARAAAGLMKDVLRPALPLEARMEGTVSVSQTSGVQEVKHIVVDAAGAEAFIAAASRIQNDEHPDALPIEIGPAPADTSDQGEHTDG